QAAQCSKTTFENSNPETTQDTKGTSMTAQYQVQDGVAVITLDNPPVNGLGHSTRLGIVEGMTRALDDAAVKAIVITGAGKAFSGGADIREFNTPKATQEPTLHSVIRVIEGSSKPVVAGCIRSRWVAAWNWRSAATTAW